MNLEIDQDTLNELEHAFKFNDAVLRHLIVAMDEAVISPSPMMKEEKSRSLTERTPDRGERGGERPDRPERTADRGERAAPAPVETPAPAA
jgi:small subunit ribosomal protein S6